MGGLMVVRLRVIEKERWLRNEWPYVAGWYGAIVLWCCVMLCLYHCIIVHGWRFIIIIMWRWGIRRFLV